MINRLGLVSDLLPRVFGFLSCLLGALVIASSQDIMGSEIQRTKHVDGNLTIEAKSIETDGSDLLAVLIEDANLQGKEQSARIIGRCTRQGTLNKF
jgi:hypothetical protein